MLITKTVKTKIKGNVCDFYQKNNIEVEFNKDIDLPIEKLNPNSHIKVDVVCDVCGKEKKIEYRRYNKSLKNGGYYSCSPQCAKNKTKDTIKEKYGKESFFETDEFKLKSEETSKERWGKKHFRKSEKWKQDKSKEEVIKRKKSIFNQFMIDNPMVVGEDKTNFICRCEEHGEYKIPKSIFTNRKCNNNELCIKCNPISKNISGKEIKLRKIVETITDKTVIPNHKIEGKEIDIYIPELKLGIEFNGLRWHSELYNSSYNLLEKTEHMKNHGIRIVHVFEDDFDNKLEIIKSIIGNLLNKSRYVIYGRKTELRKIEDRNLVKEFLDKNHLQGYHHSKYNYGLYYEGELVSLMTFTSLRKVLRHEKEGYELLRFCNKINYRVVGGASKLLKEFIRDINPQYILSYSDKTWASGKMYENMGFKYTHTTKPNYWYVNRVNRESRIKYQKHKMVSMGYDKNKTEREITKEMGLHRIYGCGNDVYEMTLR